MYEDTITVFNKKEVNNVITWYPTIIENVELQVQHQKNIDKTGLEDACKAELHINYSLVGNVINVKANGQDKPYNKPKQWIALADNTTAFTFQESEDFFMLGAYSDLPINDSEYDNGFYDEILNTYDDVFLVKSVDIFKTIPHFEVGGV